MPVGGLFTDDARNVGGRTRILKRYWQHEQSVAAAKPTVFVPTRQRKARQRAKKHTIRQALDDPPEHVIKRSNPVQSQRQASTLGEQTRGSPLPQRQSPRQRRQSQGKPKSSKKTQKKKAESEIDSKDAGEADGETKFKDDVDDLSPEVKQVNSQSDSESSHSSHSSHSGGGRGSDSNHTQKHKRISGSAAGQSATKSAKASNELLALVETDYLDRNHRPRRPDHYIEIADWRGIRVEYGSDGSADDDSDGAGSSTGKRSVDLIRVGSYVRLAPGVDTFGCLNFGDRGIVTRMVSSRNASVPHRPRDAQAYEVLGPRNPGMFWFERGEIEKCPQKLFSPREWSRRKRCNTKKARIARAAKARKEWLLEERRRQYRRSRKGSRPKSLSNAPLNTDEAWRERGAEKLSKWRKQAEEEKAALVAVVKHSDKGPWVSHVHTERMIDMYEQTLRDRRKPLRQRAGIAVDPTQAGSRIDYTEASLRDGLHGLQSPSPVKSHRSRADEIVSHSPRRTQQLQVSKDRQRPSRRPKTAALLAGGYTSGILDQYNRERRFIASSKGLPSDAGYKGTVPALEQTRRSIGKPRNRRVHYAEDVLNDDDVMPPEQRLVVKTMAQGRIIDRRKGVPAEAKRHAQEEYDLQVLKDDLRTQIIEQRIYRKADLEDFFELVGRLEKWNEGGVQRVMQELREEFYMTEDD